MDQLRRTLFWIHLVAALSAGIVIFIMSVTGALLAFQPQVLAFIERDVQRVQPPVDRQPRLGPQALLEAAAAAKPGVPLSGMTLDADRTRTAVVTFGSAGTLYLNPYTGEVLGGGSPAARAVFRSVTDWHRWLAASGDARATARSITGASNLAFLLLAISGLFLWWPRTRSRRHFRAVTAFDGRLRGKARDFNWHNVVGVWCAPVLIVLTLTAAVISYPWATRLVYMATGTAPPAPTPAVTPPTRPQGPHTPPALPANLDTLFAAAETQLPSWSTIAFRMPPRENGPVSFTMTDAAHWNRFARSTLVLDSMTADVVRWDPYADTNRGQKLRGWMRYAHTGELGGILGQTIAGVASAGGGVLVWTGFALAYRRLKAWQARRQSGAVSAQGTQAA